MMNYEIDLQELSRAWLAVRLVGTPALSFSFNGVPIAEFIDALIAETESLQQKVLDLESSEKALRAQLSTKDLLVQSLREDRLAHEVKMQKLREALIAGDCEAAARIMGGSDQARGAQ